MGRRQAGRGDSGSCHSAQERLCWQASPPALRIPLLSGTLPDGKSARVKMASGAVRGTVPGERDAAPTQLLLEGKQAGV